MSTSTVSEVTVKRYQSLYDVSLKLGKLTVIMGHSNSGKSAFGRSLRAIARNSVSPGHVSKGETSAGILLTMSDGSGVALKRGKGESTYTLINEHGHAQTYAKCGTSVPEDVKAVLRTPEGDPDVFFSTQFDSPWLLGVTGSQAAKVLGDLTNVSLLSEAAREANRRRSEVLKLAGIRRNDAESAMRKLNSEYSDLGQRKQAVDEARELLASVIDQGTRVEQLQNLADKALTALEVVTRATKEAESLNGLLTQVMGEIHDLEELESSIDEVEGWARQATEAHTGVLQNSRAVEEAKQTLWDAETEIHDLLKEAGVCPLCNQTIN